MRNIRNSKLLTVVTIGIILFTPGCKFIDMNESDPEISEKVRELISGMTLDEKIGQMTQVDRSYLDDINDIKTYYLGSLLSGGGSAPPVNTPSSWAEMTDQFQSHAMSTRLKIPLLYGIDAVHGHNNVIGATIFPHNIGLGATNDPEIVRKASVVTAEEVAATGIHWTFSPCIAVPMDERWGRHYEGYSESPDIVKELGAASIRGYQGSDLSDRHTILACAKHYVGDGGVAWGTGMNGKIDRGNTSGSEEFIRAVHMPGYLSALKEGVGSIMISFSSINNNKLHGSKYYITDILKGELGFKGFVVSDWAGINEIDGNYKSDIEISINAGLDMIMVPEHYKEFISLMKELVNEGKIPMDRIDDAVSRILTVKFELGLFDHPYSDSSLLGTIGSVANREIAREAVQKSMVVLKNENSILPVNKNTGKILVTGSNADDLGNQCGGWTISWQGSSGDITPGTTIYEAIKNTVSSSTDVEFSLDGTGVPDADVAIAVIGETPYAEMQGDSEELYLSDADIQMLSNLKNSEIPTVVLMVSGRPLIIEEYLNDWDGFIAAWLPGTEGQGVADVLFGDYNPTGRLSFSWPRTMSQIPVNIGDDVYDPLFEFGTGLSY